MIKIKLQNTLNAYYFIKNIERLSKIKSWGIDAIRKLSLSSMLKSDGTSYWNYFNA